MVTVWNSDMWHMINGNESDVANIDSELLVNIYVWYLWRNFKELFISRQPEVWLRWGLDHCSFYKKTLKIMNNNKIGVNMKDLKAKKT